LYIPGAAAITLIRSRFATSPVVTSKWPGPCTWKQAIYMSLFTNNNYHSKSK